jgi:ABC-type branched-subunit amino acid transport system ATPase component
MLTVTNLKARYGSARVLHGISFELPDDSLTALLGRNGSGKTSTARSLMGVAVKNQGEIVFNGKPIRHLPTHRRALLGMQMVPEDRRIYTNFTVRQNLELAHAAVPSDKTPLKIAQVVALIPAIEPFLDRMGNELSGGEQQMVAIARALVARPEVLIMDEPSQGLAPVILENIRDAVSMLRREFGTSVLLAEQNVRFAINLADDVIVIDKGALVFSGTRQEFLDKEDVSSLYLSV